MVGLKFSNWMGSIRKSIKKHILKKNFSSYHGFFIINKNVFFLKKLITPKLTDQFFEKIRDNARY